MDRVVVCFRIISRDISFRKSIDKDLKQLPLVIALAFILFLESVIVSVFGVSDIQNSHNKGNNILLYISIC